MKSKTGTEEVVSCVLCGSIGLRPWTVNRDFMSQESFALHRCTECGLVRTVFPYPESELARYYGLAYYGEGGRRFLPPVERAIRAFRGGRARFVRRRHPEPGRVLDVGCGRAIMLSQLKALGWDCVGTEFSEDIVVWAREKHGIEVWAKDLEACGFGSETFDMVTLWHSLEHMVRPLAVLRESARVLKPGGVLVVEVPNIESLQALIGRGRWFHIDAPRHQVHFGRSHIRTLLGQVGLERICETTVSIELGFYGMWQTLLNLATVRMNVLYLMLRRFRAGDWAGRRTLPGLLATLWDVVATVLFLAPALVAGTILEAGACLTGRGGIIRIAARKRESVSGLQSATGPTP